MHDPFWESFLHHRFESCFSDSQLHPLKADTGFAQTGFFKKGVGAGSLWESFFALSVGKLFFKPPHALTADIGFEQIGFEQTGFFKNGVGAGSRWE